jgi:membrane-associated protease RseP (regulator of RpoE activity)
VTNFPRAMSLEEQQANELRAQRRRPIPLRRQLGNLALITAAIVIPFVVTHKLSVLLMIGCLAFFIMFHEFGHFVAAKASGMKVTEFFIGFGPRLFSFRIGETDYGIKAIPAGGYVKIIGMNAEEEVAPQDELRTYRRQRWYKRVITILAGPATHFLMAFLLLVAIFGFSGRPQLSTTIGQVLPERSAAAAGLVVGDRVTKIQGVAVNDWFDVVHELDRVPSPRVDLEVVRADGTTKTITAVRRLEGEEGHQSLKVGIGPAPQIYVTEGLGTSVTMAGSTLGQYTKLTIGGIGRFFSPTTISNFAKQVTGAHSNSKKITDQELENRPTSIVGMTQIGAQAAREGVTPLLEILVIINLALGSFNLLPMLPLDGGHIVVATYESIVGKLTGRRHFVNMNRVMPVVAVFFGLLMLLGLSSIYLDIVRPVVN